MKSEKRPVPGIPQRKPQGRGLFLGGSRSWFLGVLSWHGLKREAHGLGQCKLPLGRSWDVGTAASDPQNVGRRTRVVTHGMVEGPNHGMVEGQIIEWWKDMKDEQHWFLLSQSDVESSLAPSQGSCEAFRPMPCLESRPSMSPRRTWCFVSIPAMVH